MTFLESRTSPTPDGAHADDETLVRLIDGETLDGEQHLVAHAASCATCQARIDGMRRRRARLTDLLTAADRLPVPVPAVDTVMALAERRAAAGRLVPRRSASHRRTPTTRTIVACTVILSGAALAAQPVTRWVTARWHRSANADSRPPASTPLPAIAASPATIAFVPQLGELTISYDATPASGTLTLRFEAGTKVNASITSGARDEEFIVLPNGLGVRNSPASVASYVVLVPSGMDRVRVRVGTGPLARTVTVRIEPGRSHQVPLSH